MCDPAGQYLQIVIDKYYKQQDVDAGEMDLQEEGGAISTQLTQEPPAVDTLVPLNRIRVETALSRFPIHKLAKKENVAIDIERAGRDGEADIRWEVTHSQKFGQPGPLAYKVDTLIVNRRIDAAGRPLPGVIKLGSLTEICAALGIGDSGENRANIRKALHQNASAYITAKIRYRTKTGKEKWGEIGYTRYSVIFTGEMLPDGKVADAVYIVPNTSYRELLNHVEVRPLDYDYLMLLAPGAQRFYELLSFQVYGALAGGRPRAKLLYSEYCKHAPQTRYPNFDRVKKQMYKLHVPHREAGYITKVDYQQTRDAEGTPDWEMLYTPGLKAIKEFEAFTRRQVRRSDPTEVPRATGPQAEIAARGEIDVSLLAELTRRGVAEKRARELLAGVKPDQEVLDQLEYVDAIVARDRRGKLDNPPGLYVLYVRDNLLPPLDFPTRRKRQLQEDGRQAREGEQVRAAQLKLDYKAHCAAEVSRYAREVLSPEECKQMFERHRRQNRSLLPHLSDVEISELAEGTVRAELRDSGRVGLPSFEEFLEGRPTSLDK
jgi:hypothetical protein